MILFWPKEYLETCEQGEEGLWSVSGGLGQPRGGCPASRSERHVCSRGARSWPDPVPDGWSCAFLPSTAFSVFILTARNWLWWEHFFFFYHGNWPVTQISTFLPFREWRLNIRSTPLHVGHLFPSLIHGRSYQWVLQHVPSWSTGEAQNPFQYVFQAVMTSELGSLKIYLSWSHVSCSGLQSGVEECSSNIWML